MFPDKDLNTIVKKIINKPSGSIYESDLLNITEIKMYLEENICNLEYLLKGIDELWKTVYVQTVLKIVF